MSTLSVTYRNITVPIHRNGNGLAVTWHDYAGGPRNARRPL